MYLVNKNIGETPLQCLERLFNTKQNKYTYCGRLDPMAEGKMIVLEGEECKEAEKYKNLNKTYEYSFIIGIQTDTFDTLGCITKIDFPKEKVKITLPVGKIKMTYPPYSSKTVNGIALFEYARKNIPVKLPAKEIDIFSNEILEEKIVNMRDLKKEIIDNIRKVKGDFRQKEIIKLWEKVEDRDVQLIKAKMSASSGTYVRSIVNNLPGYPTTVISINRTEYY